jgi:hypothetical protein
VPSVLEEDFSYLAVAEDAGLCYSLNADLAAECFGVVLRAQRAGDVVLSRPVFVGREWMHRFWDATESWIPEVEWRGHW